MKGPCHGAEPGLMQGNLNDAIPAHLPSELFETLAGNNKVRIERIVSQGHQSPANFWYDQAEHEFVLVHQGSAKIQFEHPAETVTLDAGDYLFIPAHRRHRVLATQPNSYTVWLAVFFPA